MKRLYRIFMPFDDKNKEPHNQSMFYQWEATVTNITGGVTIYGGATGIWIDPETEEKVIEDICPVDIACEPEQMQVIAQFTKNFFDQKEVMYYELSDKVFTV